MKKVNDFWVDDNNNQWHCKAYNREMAEQLANTLIDCYDCVDCAHCHNCYNCKNCNYCSHCNGCQNCNSCYHCTDCMYCNDCATSRNISNCEHCVKSKDCDQCVHCRVCTLCDRCNNCYRCYGVADGSDLDNQKVLSPKVTEVKEETKRNEYPLSKYTANRDEVLLGVTTDIEREVYNFVHRHLGCIMSPLIFNVEHQYSYATIRFETLPDKLFQDCKDEGFNIINNGVIYTNHRLAVIHINNDSIHARMFKNKDYLDKYLSVHYPNLNRVNLDTRLNPKNILKYKFRDDDIFIIRSICNAVHATTYTEGTDKNDNPRLAVIPVGEVTESIIRTLDTLRYNFYYNNNITNRGSNVSIVVRKTKLAVYIFDAKDQALSFIQSIKFNPLD